MLTFTQLHHRFTDPGFRERFVRVALRKSERGPYTVSGNRATMLCSECDVSVRAYVCRSPERPSPTDFFISIFPTFTTDNYLQVYDATVRGAERTVIFTGHIQPSEHGIPFADIEQMFADAGITIVTLAEVESAGDYPEVGEV